MASLQSFIWNVAIFISFSARSKAFRYELSLINLFTSTKADQKPIDYNLTHNRFSCRSLKQEANVWLLLGKLLMLSTLLDLSWMSKLTPCSELLNYVDLKTLEHRRYSLALALFYKCMYNMAPISIKEMFRFRKYLTSYISLPITADLFICHITTLPQDYGTIYLIVLGEPHLFLS